MRRDYAADLFYHNIERAERAKRCPIAAALRDEINAAPWDNAIANEQADVYGACCDALSSGVDLTPAEVVRLRQMARLEAK